MGKTSARKVSRLTLPMLRSGGNHQHGDDFSATMARRTPGIKSSIGMRSFAEKFFHQLVVAFRDHLYQFFVSFLGVIRRARREFLRSWLCRRHRACTNALSWPTRSITPRKPLSVPMGSCNATTLLPKACCSDSIDRSKLAKSRSIQVSTNARGMSYSRQKSQSFSVVTCAPT